LDSLYRITPNATRDHGETLDLASRSSRFSMVDMKTPKLIFLVSILLTGLSACSTIPKDSKSNSKTGAPTGAYNGHGASSVSPEVVAKYAPPPLPKEVADRVRNLLEVQSPGLGLPSIDGKTLYFTWAVTGVPQVWKVDGPMRFPEQLTSGSDPTLLNEVTPDGRYLIVSRDRAGEENPGLYLLPAAGGDLIEIQHKKDVRTSFAYLSADGDTVYYLANDIKPDSFALYSYSIPTKEKELLFSEPGIWEVADVIGDTKFLLSKSTGAVTAEYWRFNTETKKVTPVLGQGAKEEFEASFGATPDELFVLTSKFGEYKRLYRVRGE
jgi:hypothetical protein